MDVSFQDQDYDDVQMMQIDVRSSKLCLLVVALCCVVVDGVFCFVLGNVVSVHHLLTRQLLKENNITDTDRQLKLKVTTVPFHCSPPLCGNSTGGKYTENRGITGDFMGMKGSLREAATINSCCIHYCR